MNHTADQRRVPVAVIGASALFPGSVDATGFWRNILEGNDLLTDVPESHWLISDYYDPDPSVPDKTYAKRGAFLPEVDFDSLAWGVPPSIVPETDTSQLLALIVAQKLLDDATGGDESRIDRATTSVILGVTSGQELFGSMVARLQRPVWVKALRESGIPEDEVSEICDRIVAQYAPWNESTFPGLLGNVVAGRIANRLNLGGTNCVTDAACASSFAAIAMGLNELYLGDSEVVLAGGVDTMNDIFMYMCFSKTPALSPSGDCRPFSEQADGTMLGEGLGMVALKRLDDAERDGDRVYAVIDSVGTSSDGRSKSVYAPVSAGQALALRRAYERAGHGPGEVELVEAHGTGTVAGDAAEFGGLALAFDEADRDDRQWCALGSVKSQIGHTKAAAGAAGLIKAIMALHHQVLPPTLKIDRPNPKLELEQSPFHFATRSRPWVRGSDHPRRASVSSFGFGGSNYHLALSEYTGTEPLESDVARSAAPADRLRSMPAELVALSAGSPAELVAAARALAADSLDGGRLAYVAHESQLAFDPSSAARLAVVATDEADLAQRLTQVAERIEASPDETLALNGVVHYSNHPRTDGDTAFVFSGQGSQRIDMGGDLAMQFRRAIEAWDLAADLGAEGTPPLHRVVFPPSAFTEEDRDAASARLSSTEWAQPAIGCTSLSMLRLLASLGLEAQRFAGHSFGEITALHAAGALSAEALIAVARRRGELMAEAATVPGAMLAVSESIDQVQSLLDDWGVPVVVANHNSPKQVVLSGATDDIEAVSDKLSGVGIAVKRLPVATAFHSTIVAGASEGFTDYLGGVDISAPAGAVYSNLTARQYENDPEEIRGRLGAQLAAPVRYVEMIEQMYADGARTFVEVGPGSIQAGLIRQILADRPHLAVSLDRPGRNGVTSLLGALAELAVAGHRFDFEALWEGFGVPSDPRDEVRAKVAVRINGANYGRPYPPAGGAAALPAPNPPRPARAEPPVGSEWGGAADSLRPSMSPPPAADDRIPMMAPPSHAQAPSHPVASTAGRGPEPSTEAFFESQRQTAHAHEVYLRTMADAHAAFLDAMRVTIEPPGPHAVAQALAAMPPAPVEAPTHLSSGAATTAVPAASAVSPAVAGAEVTAPDVATGPLAADPVPGPAAGGDLAAVLLEVVSDKTGYPVEMLGLDLELEGDLGIDSIKRVEILSEMTDREPSLPEFDTAVLAELQTLGQVLEHMSSALGRGPVATGPLAADPVPGPAAGGDLAAVLLEVVSDKTGYPVEMLGLDLELEGDLGIDSIKRVEILSEMTDREPSLPEFDTAVLAELQTLGQVLEHMSSALGREPVATGGIAAGPLAADPVPGPAAGGDLAAVLLEVVSDKTGYPVEMLGLDLELEGDLGIDSIKRVEILSEMTDREPSLPEFDTAVLAELQTLGQVLEHMSSALGREPVATGGNAAGPLAADPVPGPAATAAPKGASTNGTGGSVGDPPERHVIEAVPAAPSGLAPVGLHGPGSLLITGGDRPLVDALVAALAERGVDAVGHEVAAEVATDAAGLVVLGAIGGVPAIDAAIDVNRAAFAAARSFGRVRGGDVPAVFVTVQDTGGAFGLTGFEPSLAWAAGLASLARTAHLEWPSVSAKAIDIAGGSRSVTELAALLADEIVHGGPDLEVGIGPDGTRLVLVNRPAAPLGPRSEPSLEAGDVVVASGGARGVTAAALVELAGRLPLRFVLLGRTELTDEPACTVGVRGDAELKRALLTSASAAGTTPRPSELGRQVEGILAGREVRATIAAIEAAGSTVRYVVADVASAESVRGALADVRATWGSIRGLVHGAGVLADKLIVDKTDDQFARVFDTKVAGLRSLLSATADDPLRLIAVFSSVAARCGNPGQVDYAMANEVLNKVASAEARRRSGECLVKSFGWGPWDGGMVNPQLKSHFESMGVPLIGIADGARLFADEALWGSPSEVELVVGGSPDSAVLNPDSAPRAQRCEVLVGRASHPYLVDHTVNGTTVLPFALALEWMTRAAGAFRPDLHLAALREVRVTKGVLLPEFDETERRLWISCEGTTSETDRAVVSIELTDACGTVHYKAVAELGAEEPPWPEMNGHLDELDAAGWDASDPYDSDVLFHGPKFRVISSIGAISDQGAVARMLDSHSVGWHTPGAGGSNPPLDGGFWLTDPAAIDGALQLALLWCERALGGSSLPTAIEAVRTWRASALDGPINCTLVGRQASGKRSVSDVLMFDGAGSPVAELIGIETHLVALRPSGG